MPAWRGIGATAFRAETYFFTVTLGKCRLYVRRGLLPEDWAGDANEDPSGYGERRE
jgi:hypothetical protein